MISKEVTYTDYNGDEQTETLYFNLTKAELIDLDASYPTGMKDEIDKATKNQDGKVMIKLFKDVIARSYGERSVDGKRFIKSEEKTKDFFTSEVYSALFMDLINDPDSGSTFVQGLLANATRPR